MSAHPHKILVAEHDLEFRGTLTTYLVEHGYEVVAVEDGFQAIDSARKDAPDLMILDVHMPSGDGFSVHDRMQGHADLAGTPVIYMTRDPDPLIEVEAQNHGALALLHKPFEMEDLLTTIRRVLSAADAA